MVPRAMHGTATIRRTADRGPIQSAFPSAHFTVWRGRPRTTGIASAEQHAAAAEALLRSDVASPTTPADARGKLVVLGTNRTVRIAQIVNGLPRATVLCGHATAAAAVLLGDGEPVRLAGPAADITAEFQVDGNRVRQAWTLLARAPRSITVGGALATTVDALNPYLILTMPTSAQILAAKRWIGRHADRKVAIVRGDSARFLGAQGEHGGAPLTGIVSLALAAASLDLPQVIRTPAGDEALPKIAWRSDGRAAFELPECRVELKPLEDRP